jgi:hypothetical protein
MRGAPARKQRACAKRNAADGLTDSDNNLIEAYATDGQEDVLVRRGFRGDKFVALFKRQPLTRCRPRPGRAAACQGFIRRQQQRGLLGRFALDARQRVQGGSPRATTWPWR